MTMNEQPKITSVPWDTSLGNRLAHYSAEDHSAPLWIAALLSFTYMLGMLFVRAFLKWRVFGWDNSAMVLSTVSPKSLYQFRIVLTRQVLASLQSILIFNALKAGLGKIPGQETNLTLAGKVSKAPTFMHCVLIETKLVFSSRIVLVLSLYLAKPSVLYLLRRIFIRDQKMITLLCDIIIGLTVAGGLVSVLISAVGCPTSSFFVEHCYNQVNRVLVQSSSTDQSRSHDGLLWQR